MTLRWIGGGALVGVGALAIVANWSLIIGVLVTRRSGVSMIPFVGGLFGMLGLLVLPANGTAWWAWIALVLDPTCVPGVVSHLVHVGRLRRTAVERLAKLPCPRCGAPIGMEVASKARSDWIETTRRAHEHAREHGLRVRIDGRWHLACPGCGTQLWFDPEGIALRLVEDTRDGDPDRRGHGHLSYASHPDRPPWPSTTVFENIPEFIEKAMKPDHADYGTGR
jgi:hypothetical protein